jgi:maltooligosyltrehalose synthase
MDVNKIRERLQQDPSVRNRVARRAYELFIQRGRQMGREAEDWFKAEAEILAELMQETAQHKEEAIESEVSHEVALVEATTVAPKKRTYTKKKKDAEVIAEQVEVKPVVVAKEAAKPAAKRGRSKTTVATDLA